MYRLLIVDNNADRALHTASVLDWSVYGITAIEIAVSCGEAASKARRMNPQLALVNLQLDGTMGYELVAKLRSIGLKTAFCILAEENRPELIRECMRSGAQDYLLRPLNVEEIQNFLERTITEKPPLCEEEVLTDASADPVLGISCKNLSRLTNTLIRIVHNDYRSPQSLTSIAADLDMSSKYMGRVFLKDTGMKFSEYLMSYRMLEARKRIIRSREKISVIAASVGYVQMNNFYIHFKNYFGVSPSALRSIQGSQDSDTQSGESYEKPF